MPLLHQSGMGWKPPKILLVWNQEKLLVHTQDG
jgi:hypothetical protein